MSAEVSVFAPMAAEGAGDTGQAPAETQTARGRDTDSERRRHGQREAETQTARGGGASPRAGRVPRPSCPDGSPTPESHSQGLDWGAPPALKVVASPSKMLRGPENCVQSGNDVSESSGAPELVRVSS